MHPVGFCSSGGLCFGIYLFPGQMKNILRLLLHTLRFVRRAILSLISFSCYCARLDFFRWLMKKRDNVALNSMLVGYWGIFAAFSI